MYTQIIINSGTPQELGDYPPARLNHSLFGAVYVALAIAAIVTLIGVVGKGVSKNSGRERPYKRLTWIGIITLVVVVVVFFVLAFFARQTSGTFWL